MLLRRFCWLALLVVSCNGGAQAPRTPVSAAVTPAPETFHPRAPRAAASALLFLAGSQVQQLVKYDVVDGFAVLEGDILLGPAPEVPLRYALPWAPSSNVKSAVASVNKSHLWPRSEIPYVIDGSVSARTRGNIAWAIQHMSQTPLRLRPANLGERDYVVFRTTDGCSSYVGRIGGPQDIMVEDGCLPASIVHEILHAAGFYHEQSRGDRDAFVTISWSDIYPGFEDNFFKRDGRGQDIGPYDYASLMHYGATAFSRTGRPTIIPHYKVPIGQRSGLSEGDRAAINALYGTGEPLPPAPPTLPGNPQPIPPPTASGSSFAGSYRSNRGDVACSQNGSSVSCTFPGGSMLCAAMGTRLDCGWLGGGGSGRATFDRQPDGKLVGTYGDFFSSTSRGSWDLVPAGAGPAPQPFPPPTPPTPPPTAPPPAQGGIAGNYSTTRGPMACTESGSVITCGFRQNDAEGRLDCLKDATGLQLQCTWTTLLPAPGSGRASFARASTGTRAFTGTWGYLFDSANGGRWDLSPM